MNKYQFETLSRYVSTMYEIIGLYLTSKGLFVLLRHVRSGHLDEVLIDEHGEATHTSLPDEN